MTSWLPRSRTNGECCCPIQCSSEANSTSANRQALSCSSFCAASCFPCHAPSNSVPRATRLAPSHDASPEAEPHNSHSKTSWAGPSGDPPGKRVPVREARESSIKSAFAALFCLLHLNFKIYHNTYGLRHTHRRKLWLTLSFMITRKWSNSWSNMGPRIAPTIPYLGFWWGLTHLNEVEEWFL